MIADTSAGCDRPWFSYSLGQAGLMLALLREAPLRKLQGLFGHCPNSDCTPPFTQTGTLGHFISGPTWANAIWGFEINVIKDFGWTPVRLRQGPFHLFCNNEFASFWTNSVRHQASTTLTRTETRIKIGTLATSQQLLQTWPMQLRATNAMFVSSAKKNPDKCCNQ